MNELNIKKSVSFMLLSAFAFSLMQVCVKLSGTSIPLMQQMFFRNFITLFISAFILFKEKITFFGKKENRKYLFLRAFLGFTGVTGQFYATNHMVLSDASIIHQSSPIFVSIFAAILFKRKLSKTKIFCILISFLGAMLVVRPKFDFNNIPALVSLISAMITGMSHIALTIANKYEKPYTIVFFFSIFSTICSFPIMVMNFVMPNLYEGLLLLGIGTFAGIGQIALTFAYKNAPASKVSIYSYTIVIFSLFFSVSIFGSSIQLYSIIGVTFIFASAIYDYYVQQKNESIQL